MKSSTYIILKQYFEPVAIYKEAIRLVLVINLFKLAYDKTFYSKRIKANFPRQIAEICARPYDSAVGTYDEVRFGICSFHGSV
jgi:hypothetical protein